MRISFDALSLSSVKQAQEQLNRYISNLKTVDERIAEKLVERGISIAEAQVGEYGAYISFISQRYSSGETTEIRFIAKSLGDLYIEWDNGGYNISPLLMAEYGSGHHVVDEHEKKSTVAFKGALSYTVGSGQVNRKSWQYKKDGVWHTGNTGYTPTMPVFTAFKKMIEDVELCVREAFNEVQC